MPSPGSACNLDDGRCTLAASSAAARDPVILCGKAVLPHPSVRCGLPRMLARRKRAGDRPADLVRELDRVVQTGMLTDTAAGAAAAHLPALQPFRGLQARPGHLLRCGRVKGESGLIDVVVHDSHARMQLVWGQMVGQMVAAAMVSCITRPDVEPPPIFGIHVLGAAWTFLRTHMTAAYLRRSAPLQAAA